MASTSIQSLNKASSSPLVRPASRSNNTRTQQAQATSNKNFHNNPSYSKVINFGHLKSYYKLDGEVVGRTQIIDKEKEQKVDVEVRRVQDQDGVETYKLVVDNEVIAFRSLKFITEDKDTKKRSSLAKQIWSRSAFNGFGENKKNQAKVIGEFYVNKYPNKYSKTSDVFMQLISERMQELEKSKAIKFQDLQIVTSYNSGSTFYKNGFELQDHNTPDSWPAKKCDQFIQDELSKGDKANTEEMGCSTMYLPKKAINQWQKTIKTEPLMNKDGNDFNTGKVKLTKKDGTKVEATLHKEHDPNTNIDIFRIEANGEELGSIQINPMRVKNGKVHDYCGDYDASSPFSQYGNGKIFGLFGSKKAQAKVFIEIEDIMSNEFTNLKEKLYQIPIEIAIKDKEFKGRVQVEADWNEHSSHYEIGFRTQKYRGLKKKTELKEAYEKEIKAAQKQGRMPNVKQFGSQTMTLSRDELSKKYPGIKILAS